MTVPLAHDLTGVGPLLVLVHGITENRHAWDPLTDDLARDHTVLRVDLRGHGESPGGDAYGSNLLAEDVAAVVAGLGQDAGPPLLVGHSLGGAVVTAYAAAGHAVRGVVNVDQMLDLGFFQAGLQAQADALRGPGFPAVVDGLFESMRGSLPDDEWARLAALRRADQEVVLGVWALLLDSSPAELAQVIDAMLAAVRAPYLEVDGFDLGTGYADWLAQRLPHARLEVWDGMGHYPHLVDPQRFLDRVRKFEAGLG